MSMYLKGGSHFDTLLDIGCGLEVDPDVDGMSTGPQDYLHTAKTAYMKQGNKDKNLEINRVNLLHTNDKDLWSICRGRFICTIRSIAEDDLACGLRSNADKHTSVCITSQYTFLHGYLHIIKFDQFPCPHITLCP